MGNHSIYGGGGVFYAFLKPTFHLTLLWFSVVTVLCDFLCNVMRKAKQKQWQIFCGKVLRKLVWLGNQRVTNDLLFPFYCAGGFGADVVDYAVYAVDFIDDAIR